MEGEMSVAQNPAMPDRAMRITRAVVSSVSLLFGLAAVLALSVAVIIWAMRPDYSALMDNASDADIAAMTAVLSANKIAYKIDSMTGNLLVANHQKQQARLLVSSEGLPRSSPLGYELLKKDSALGTSQFLETARYQHALETELSRSIASMRDIDSARVHLALPKRTAFMRKKEPASASVMVKVSAGRRLHRHQVNSIAYLVSSSVAYLDAAGVAVVDQWGKLLSSTGADKALAASQKQLAYKQEIESLYINRIESMLAPVFGYGRTKVQVNAEMDFTRIESTQELFDADENKIRSEQIIDQQQTGIVGAIGIPGALTNQPPAGGTVEQAPADEEAAASRAPTNSNRNALKNYELDKTIRHVQQPVGEIQKITVAVVADDWVAVDAAGAEVRTRLSAQDLDLIRGIVREAIGFNEQRGDSISVYNKSFQAVSLQEMPALPWWQQDWFMTLIKQALAGIAVLILIFTVVKPAMKTIQSRFVDATISAEEQNQQALLASLADQDDSNERPQDTGENTPEPAFPNYVEQLAMARQLVEQDSRQVAKVVKNWVSDSG